MRLINNLLCRKRYKLQTKIKKRFKKKKKIKGRKRWIIQALIELIVLLVVLIIALPFIKPKIATFLNNKGIEYYDKGNVSKAITFLRRSLFLQPDPSGHFSLANIYQNNGYLEFAILEYEKVLQSDPNYIKAYYGLADIYRQKNMYKDALYYLEKVKFLDPDNANKAIEKLILSLYNETAILYNKGLKAETISKLEKLLQLKPDFALAYKMIGDIDERGGAFKKAISNYKRAIKFGVDKADIYNSIGICYMRIEDYKEAIKYLRKAYHMEPSRANLAYNLASTLRDNGSYDEALVIYKELIDKDYDYPNVHNDVADIYELRLEKEEAEKEYRKELEIVNSDLEENPENTLHLVRLATAYNGLKQYQKARDIIDKVIKEDPDYGEALYVRAIVYENLGYFEMATKDLKRAKELFPRGQFIDDFIARLREEREGALEGKGGFLPNTVVYLKNGRKMSGKLIRETDNKIYLEVLYGQDKGTIGISRGDIKSIEAIE